MGEEIAGKGFLLLPFDEKKERPKKTRTRLTIHALDDQVDRNGGPYDQGGSHGAAEKSTKNKNCKVSLCSIRFIQSILAFQGE